MPDQGPKALCWLARLSNMARVIRGFIKPWLKTLFVGSDSVILGKNQ
tara:strand:- start:491 stop:631 length:141 start_codon:yes stop_codon:yes gene_type:complete